MTLLCDVALGVGVSLVWFATIAFARMRWALDRLHVGSFTLLAAGCPFVVAAWLQDGVSPRTIKFTLVWLLAVIAGASMNQAIGRTIFARDEAAERL